jgi:hypothetical protein
VRRDTVLQDPFLLLSQARYHGLSSTRRNLVLTLSSRSCSQLTCFAALCILLAGGAAAADLQVEVRNVKPRKGEVRAALFDNAEAFASAVKIRDKGNLDEDPRWEDAKFTLPPEGLSMVVHLLNERRADR